MTDHFGFTMAALNENGSVFANPCKGEKNMSTLMYRPFSSWASNSEVRLCAYTGHIFYRRKLYVEQICSCTTVQPSMVITYKDLKHFSSCG